MRGSVPGDIPEGLCNLTSLQVLDLSGNQLTGPIPRSLNGLIAMLRPQASHRDLFYRFFHGGYYEESLSMQVKGGTRTHTKILSLVISIDVSHNAMSGEIPEELMSFKGLVNLSLSVNRFRGGLSNKVRDLAELSSLDVSEITFSGPISPSTSQLGSLGYLNFSNFSGAVPYAEHLMTFEANAFSGNPYLCGPPLARRCHLEGGGGGIGVGDGGGSSTTADRWMFLSGGSGFAVGAHRAVRHDDDSTAMERGVLQFHRLGTPSRQEGFGAGGGGEEGLVFKGVYINMLYPRKKI
ncbi:hypothetical protein QJS04_geneDACA005590 [Acorus gramineus]|uniref:Uncharacterized protein n=1 Tax=Acorus gramineus TaxID=55184 RepID=A0AAV9A5U9_ACOGR|nr:hypothetical protein QJS04_geneDACA005590 [Acorus gramineus]